MKAEFLKLAKVKDEKSFYKKYPTEEAFFKAHPEAKKHIKKAQTGTDVNGNGIPDYLENSQGMVQPQMGPYNQPPSMAGMLKPAGLANFNVPMPSAKVPTAADLNPAQADVSLADKAAPYIGAASDVMKGISSLKAQGKEKDRMRQMRKITDLYKVASGTREEEPERRYNTPYDNMVQPDQVFPTYGVGTNVLTGRNGVMLYSGGEIQNTYAPDNLYDDLGYEPLYDSDQVKQYYYGGGIPRAQEGFSAMLNNSKFGKFMTEQGGGQALGMLTGAMNDNSGGSQIGKGIGTAAGTVFGGPVGGMIGGALGGIAGGMLDSSQKSIKRDRRAIQKNMDTIMGNQFGQSFQNQYSGYVENGGDIPNYEDGGYMNPNYNPQLITMFGDHTAEDFANYAKQYRAGGHLKSYTAPSERAMETFAMGGELKTHWGGHAETMSHNPYLPGNGETVMFRGKSHDESDGYGNTGIGITYGNSPVEVERGEPAVKLKDGSSGEENLTVYGNLKIPNEYVPLLGDDRAKGKKFKNYIAEISKDEARQNKLIEKSTNQLDNLDLKNSFDKLKFEALSANIKGANMKLKSIADKKINAANLQNAINDTAEEYGLDADALARGKSKFNKEALEEYAKNGKTTKKTDPIVTKTKKIKSIKALDHVPKGQKYDESTGLWGGIGTSQIARLMANNRWYDWEDFDPGNEQDVREFQKAFNKKARENNSDAQLEVDGRLGKQTVTARLDEEETVSTKKDDPIVDEKDNSYETTPYKRSVLMDVANQILPFIRPTDQEPLDPNQLMGEMYALSNNQLEPVQAQGYRPDLLNTYDISLQDQLNANQADFNSMQRMVGYNPQAQSILAAQKYAANTNVLGEQFRQNQAMDMGIYNANTQTLNDAKLKNLEIFDRQYGRQAQAKSNTKAITQAALNSISDKYAKNRLENRELGIYENMYNYRFDSSGRAVNMNPLYQANVPTLYSNSGEATHVPVYDANGKIKGYKEVTTNKGYTPTSVNPIATSSSTSTTYTPNEDYTPLEQTQEDIYDEVAPKRKGGGKIKKNYSQSSIVRAFK